MAFLFKAKGLMLDNFTDTSASVLNMASTKLVTCDETETLERAIPILASRFRRLPVVGRKTGDFRGFISASDVLDYLGAGPKHRIFRKRHGSLKTPVKSIMETRVLTLDKNHSIKKALETFHKGRRGAYPVLYRGKLMGMVSEWDFVRKIDSPVGVRVEELMVKPMVAREGFSILDTAKIMVRSQIRRLPVARDNILLGIVTPGDILSYLRKKNLLSGLVRDKTKVTGVMNREVRTIRPRADIYDAASIMTRKRVGGLPVVEDAELLGIITERDIVDALR